MAPAAATVDTGMVHGRFQPFHSGHLEYVLQAAARCSELVVGITNPEPGEVPPEPTSPHRHLPEANPFSYWERLLMVRAALGAAGMDLARVAIVPFPIHYPSRWPHYVPPGVTHFIRVFSAWEEAKAERLRAAGYSVVELPVKAKDVSGTEVRRRLAAGEDWRDLLPAAVAELIQPGRPSVIS
ncbi:MAG: adenylyltransferase/cytidyltransferase family protein [Candidatus Dormibacteraeota bacterium]|nr:adenylyltransferase/cytidyltransferase family protein [Candidatus Dormibacteraeota bacterium]